MNQLVQPGTRSGAVTIPASKSQAHRLLICAALSQAKCTLVCDVISKDIAATIKCLEALGAKIQEDGAGHLTITPISSVKASPCHLYCGESGSTLRFLLPVVGALGARAVFHMEGRLPDRPLAPLDRELTAHGMTLQKEGNLLQVSGRLTPGFFTLPGNVSSQYISGLLMALPLLKEDSTLEITDSIESADYITMTEDALRLSGAMPEKQGNCYFIHGSSRYLLPNELTVEGDWSGAAFFLCMGALSPKGLTIHGMSPSSSQGDRRILDILTAFGADVTVTDREIMVKRARLKGQTINARMIPDLVPVISAVASVAEGETLITNAERLRIKESDRLATTAAMLNAIGASVTITEDGLLIRGKPALGGGTIDSANDHRIAMSAAVAATVCTAPVMVMDAKCVEKSYPGFWDDLSTLEVN